MSDSDDEDWFEEAFEESEEGEQASESEESTAIDESVEPEPEESGEPEGEESYPASEEAQPEPESELSEEASGLGAPEDFEEAMEEAPESFEDLGGGESGEPSEPSAEESPFSEDFSEAFENAPSPEGPGGEGGGGAFGGGGGSDAFGGEGGPMAGGEGNEEFGFGDFGGGGGGGPSGGPESFEEEELESELDRLDIGIEGLDDMILGGIPERSLMVAIGSAGTGKTTFGLQFLHTALERGENAVYITLEESRERVINTADEKGWNFSEYEENEQLAIVDFDPIEMAHSLSSIQNELPRLIDEFDADRLVLDSVSLLEMMYDKPAKRRSEVFDFTKSLKEAGVTTFVTSEASADDPYTSRHGIIEYLADAVFVLQYVRPSDFRETRLAIEIQKIRDANHSRETKPYEITNEGLSVYRQANIF